MPPAVVTLYPWTMLDYYEILEVHPRASPEVIEKAYKALCLKYHPDRRPADGRERATHTMQRLNEAYSVLSDAARRGDYDRMRAAARKKRLREADMLRVFMDDGLVGLFKVWIKEGIQ